MPRTLLFISLVAASVLIFGASLANAQYPNPRGSVTLTSNQSTSNTGMGTNVPLFCDVRDVTGAPMAGENCVFSIESEPGGANGDAAVGSKTVVRVTDSFGQARTDLYTGSTPGVIVVKATAGELQSTIIVDVAGSGLPPAAPVEIVPPSTGDGGLR